MHQNEKRKTTTESWIRKRFRSKKKTMDSSSQQSIVNRFSNSTLTKYDKFLLCNSKRLTMKIFSNKLWELTKKANDHWNRFVFRLNKKIVNWKINSNNFNRFTINEFDNPNKFNNKSMSHKKISIISIKNWPCLINRRIHFINGFLFFSFFCFFSLNLIFFLFHSYEQVQLAFKQILSLSISTTNDPPFQEQTFSQLNCKIIPISSDNSHSTHKRKATNQHSTPKHHKTLS